MKNKFDADLVQSNVFNKKAEEKAEPVRTAGPVKTRPQSEYRKVLADMENEKAKGVTVQIPMSLYRRMRDYKDDNDGYTIQSIALIAIKQWVEKNA